MAGTETARTGPYLFAGSLDDGFVFRSSDGGASWTRFIVGVGTPTVLDAVGTTLYAGDNDPTGYGLYRSDDSGSIWEPIRNCPHFTSAFFASGESLLDETQQLGLFRSTDSRKFWSQVSFSEVTINAFVSDGVRIFAGTYGEGVSVSTDSGTTWSPANKGIDSEEVMTLAIH